MKREFLEGLELEGGAKLPREVIDLIMDEQGKGIESYKNSVNQLKTELGGLKEQLTAANAEIQSFKDMDIDGIKQKASEWEQKYTADTAALRQQLDEANYGFAVKEAVGGLKFSSESAKKAFVADLMDKKLPLQDGKLLGLADFVSAYKESDAAAFAPENPGKQPIITTGSAGSGFAPGAGGYEARLADARKAGNNLEVIKIKQEAAEKGVALL